MFYLMMASTHFIYRHMVKDHSYSNLLPHGHLFPFSSKGSYMHHHTDRRVHTPAFVTPDVKYWVEKEITQ